MTDRWERKMSFEEILEKWENVPTVDNSFHLYVDSPFCIKACKYCIYTPKLTSINSDEYKDYYYKILPKEIEKFTDIIEKYNFESIYFGGGTPSLMTIEVMEHLFNIIPGFKDIPAKSFEAHPAFINKEKIDFLSDYGFTNISLGVQSFNEELIKSQNRVYVGPEKIKEFSDYIKSKGIIVNLDLLAFMGSYTKEDLHKYMAKDLEIMDTIRPTELDLYPVYESLEGDNAVELIHEYRKIIYKFLMKHPDWRTAFQIGMSKEEVLDNIKTNYKLTTVSDEVLAQGIEFSCSGGYHRPSYQNVLALGCSEIRETYSYFGLEFYYLNYIEDGEIKYKEVIE